MGTEAVTSSREWSKCRDQADDSEHKIHRISTSGPHKITMGFPHNYGWFMDHHGFPAGFLPKDVKSLSTPADAMSRDRTPVTRSRVGRIASPCGPMALRRRKPPRSVRRFPKSWGYHLYHLQLLYGGFLKWRYLKIDGLITELYGILTMDIYGNMGIEVDITWENLRLSINGGTPVSLDGLQWKFLI